jgi:predicted transcriptional regulator
MTTVELLQQIGLNKYEAEAYYTLLANEPLTGYELGKRSQVPLSRSYEVLERLTEKRRGLFRFCREIIINENKQAGRPGQRPARPGYI